MMASTNKGFEIRDYFLACERRANNPMKLLSDPVKLLEICQIHTKQSAEKTLPLTQKEVEISSMRPKAIALEMITEVADNLTLSDVAKSLKIQEGIFFKLLNELKWVFKCQKNGVWAAAQRCLKKGWLDNKFTDYVDPWTGEAKKKV